MLGLGRQRLLHLAAVVYPVGPLELAWLYINQGPIEQQRLVFLISAGIITGRPLVPGPIHSLPFLYLNFRPIHQCSWLVETEFLSLMSVLSRGISHFDAPDYVLLRLSLQRLASPGALRKTSMDQSVVHLAWVR